MTRTKQIFLFLLLLPFPGSKITEPQSKAEAAHKIELESLPLLLQLESRNLLSIKDVTGQLSECKDRKTLPEFNGRGSISSLACFLGEDLQDMKNNGNQTQKIKTRYFLKKTSMDNQDDKGCIENAFNYPLGAAYNKKLATNNLKITIPSLQFFKMRSVSRDKDNFYKGFSYYLASKDMLGFEVADGINFDRWETLLNQKNNLAKLVVAQTFIDDLHPANYGFVGNDLVLIDIDSLMPKERSDYQTLSIDQYIVRHIATAIASLDVRAPLLTRNNVENMLLIYQNMTRHPPRFQSCFDIPRDAYLALLTIYIKACQATLGSSQCAAVTELKRHERTAKNEKENKHIPEKEETINDYFIGQIDKLAKQYCEKLVSHYPLVPARHYSKR